jgi:sulfoxide reductase catalytic subunit YedY
MHADMPLDYPWWLRATHFFNFLFITLLVRSGLQVLASHPKLYWSDDALPNTEWLRVGDRERETDIEKDAIVETPDEDILWTAEDEVADWPSWFSLPGGDNLGMGRHWHFWGATGWVLTGVLYVFLLFVAGEWGRFVPTSLAIFSQAWDALLTYAQFQVPHVEGYNALQQLTYFSVIFVLTPIQIATGVLIAPALRANFPNWFGSIRQAARSIHFVGLILFVLFTLGHTALVGIHGFGPQLAKIVLGSATASHTLAIALTIIGIGAVVAFHVVGTWGSLRAPMRTKKLLEIGIEPLFKFLFHHHVTVTEDSGRVSSFARVNGRPPQNDEYRQHVADDFENWTLEINGQVENKCSFSLAELQEMPCRSQRTRHDCIQGWTYYAQWGGIPVSELIDRCQPTEDANFAVFWTLDEKWEYGEDGQYSEPHPDVPEFYYEAIYMDKATEPTTILAYEMNDENLPIAHGGPLRLRIESQLGYKMAKWVCGIEFVESLDEVGRGQGGWRDDVLKYHPSTADI